MSSDAPVRSDAPNAEAALLVRLQAGDDAAFEELVRENAPRMLAVARRFVADENEAQDILQEAFLSAFRGIQRFEGGSKISTWLHRIVVNAALMRLRKKKRRREVQVDELLPGFLEDGHLASIPKGWPAADQRLEQEDTRAKIRGLIDELPESYRSVLLLRDIEEFSTQDAAHILEITPGAVKTRLHRARQALRALIEQELANET